MYTYTRYNKEFIKIYLILILTTKLKLLFI